MTQFEYDQITKISDQTRTLIEQMLAEMEISNSLKDTYRQFLHLALWREKNAAAVAMLEYFTK